MPLLPKPRLGARVGVRGALVAVLIAVVTATPAIAHEGEQSKKATDDVRQAIAYIVNEPDNMDMITDKVGDALESDHKAGVDIRLVKQAQDALGRNDMMAARALLEESIGARPDLTGTDVQPILQVPSGQSTVPLATGEETATNVITDPLPGRRGLTGADWTLLGCAALLAVAGVMLARRWRPHDTVRQLRRRMTSAVTKP